jgi:hypothetical protein
VARESADVILIGSDLSKLVETLRVARRCRGIIMQNFVGTLVVDSIGVGMAAFGFLNPLLAAFIHVTSELAFILNSTRLLPRSSEARQWDPDAAARTLGGAYAFCSFHPESEKAGMGGPACRRPIDFDRRFLFVVR